jgi:hypothetical protein
LTEKVVTSPHVAFRFSTVSHFIDLIGIPTIADFLTPRMLSGQPGRLEKRLLIFTKFDLVNYSKYAVDKYAVDLLFTKDQLP